MAVLIEIGAAERDQVADLGAETRCRRPAIDRTLLNQQQVVAGNAVAMPLRFARIPISRKTNFRA